MPRYLTQHGVNDRAIAYDDTSPTEARLIVQGQSGTLTDTINDATGMGISVAQYGGGKISGRINGQPTTPPSLNATQATVSSGPLTIGAAGTVVPTNFVKGVLRHLIITQGATPHEILQLEGWLAWDIGRPDLLAGNHPYRNIRP